MPMELEISIDHGATVVRVRGVADTASVAAQWAALAALATDVPFVVADLDRATIASADAGRQLVALLGGAEHVCLVPRRYSLLSQLAQWRVHYSTDVHASVTDAIAAHHT